MNAYAIVTILKSKQSVTAIYCHCNRNHIYSHICTHTCMKSYKLIATSFLDITSNPIVLWRNGRSYIYFFVWKHTIYRKLDLIWWQGHTYMCNSRTCYQADKSITFWCNASLGCTNQYEMGCPQKLAENKWKLKMVDLEVLCLLLANSVHISDPLGWISNVATCKLGFTNIL